MIWIVVEIAASAIENIVIVDFLGRYLGYKNNEDVWLKSLLFFAASMFNVLIVPHLFDSEIIPSVVLVMLSLIYCMVFLRGNIYGKVFIVLFNVLSILAINTLMLTIFSFIFSTDFSELVAMRNSARIMLLATTKFLYFIITRLILKLQKNVSSSMSAKEWLSVLGIFMITLTIGVMMFEAIWKEEYSETVLCVFAVGLILINIISYTLFSRISEDNARKTELAMLELQLSEQAGRMKEIDCMYNEILHIRHDIKKCINCASILIEQGKYKEAENYLASLSSEKLGTIKEFVVLKSGVVSAVINAKLSQCKRENFLIETNISDCIEDFSEMDISILLSNLFDNAIEACEKTSCDKRLRFNMNIHKGYVRIIMGNSIDGNSAANPELKTTKADKKNHGFGIKTIKEIVEKYDGIYDFQVSDNEFVADIWLRKRGKTQSVSV